MLNCKKNDILRNMSISIKPQNLVKILEVTIGFNSFNFERQII